MKIAINYIRRFLKVWVWWMTGIYVFILLICAAVSFIRWDFNLLFSDFPYLTWYGMRICLTVTFIFSLLWIYLEEDED